MKTIVNFLRYWLPVIAWAGLIFFLSSIPQLSSGLGLADLILRKLAHMMEFGLLAYLIYRAFRQTWQLKQFDLLAWSVILSFVYAGTDEYHQLFVPGRECHFSDVLIDGLGILVFVLIVSHENIRKSKTQGQGK